MFRRLLALALLSVASHAQYAHAFHAEWIQAPFSTPRDGAELDGSHPMPIFRREFATTGGQAILRIAGLGQFDVQIDGSPIAPTGLHEAWTDYRKTIPYETYRFPLKPGHHIVTVLLGNGMYNVQKTRGRYTKFEGTFGPPKLIAELQAGNQTISTDTTWQCAPGPVTFSSTYGGEDYDARIKPTTWTPAILTESPGGNLVEAIAPEFLLAYRHRNFDAINIDNKTVYDVRQNIAGRPIIRVRGPAGATLRITPGELLAPDGTVSQRSSGGPQWWSYTLRGDETFENWFPRFSYYGFRYLQTEWVTPAKGELLGIDAEQLSSNSPITGSFTTSDPTLNAIHHLIVEAMHNNEATVFTDCPHREKLGWLEETHLVAPGLLYNNDVHALMSATSRNMADAQKPDGMIPTISPEYVTFAKQGYGVFDDSPEWGSASILAPWATYRFYGDTTDLAAAYPTMQAYIKFLESKAHESIANDGIVAYGLGDWYDIGPGGPGLGKQTSLGVTGTLMLYEDATVVQKIATILHHPEDAAAYATLAEHEKQAFNKRFWNEDTNTYDKGSQTANAMPLALGIVPEAKRAAVLEHIIADIHTHNDHVTTGEVGYPYMMRALMQVDRGDILLAMLLRKDAPSYASQLAAGATALTEAWDANPNSSQDHFMLGGAEEFFYRGLAGIDIDLSRPERLILHPALLDGLNEVHATYASSIGKIASDWKREAHTTTLTITVPIATTVILAASQTASIKAPKADLLQREATRAIYKVEPGTHTFRITTP